MPQELHVVQCYKCQTYQVDIVKVTNKWSCKMCGEKQTLKQVFATGTGKELRQFVQEANMNLRAGNQDQTIENPSLSSEYSTPSNSKWGNYFSNE